MTADTKNALDLSSRSMTDGDSGMVDVRHLVAMPPLGARAVELAPKAAPRTPRLAYVALALGAFAAFASTAMASHAIGLARRARTAPAEIAVVAAAAPAERPAPDARPAPEVAADETPAPAAPTAPEAPPPPSAPAANDGAVARRRPARVPNAPATAPVAATETRPVSAPDTTGSSLDELMARVAAADASAPAVVSPVPSLPEVPNRADVSRALSSIASRVAMCGEDGTAMVRFVFDGPSGTVRSAAVTGDLAGTSAARCVEDAARDVTLPRFERSPFVVTFPYHL